LTGVENIVCENIELDSEELEMCENVGSRLKSKLEEKLQEKLDSY